MDSSGHVTNTRNVDISSYTPGLCPFSETIILHTKNTRDKVEILQNLLINMKNKHQTLPGWRADTIWIFRDVLTAHALKNLTFLLKASVHSSNCVSVTTGSYFAYPCHYINICRGSSILHGSKCLPLLDEASTHLCAQVIRPPTIL